MMVQSIEVLGALLVGDRRDRRLKLRHVRLERDRHPVAKAPQDAGADGAHEPGAGRRQAEGKRRGDDERRPPRHDAAAEEHEPQGDERVGVGEPERHALQQPDLGVSRFDQRVGQVVFQGRFDRRPVLADLAAEGDDALMEEFFREGTLPVVDLLAGLRGAFQARRIFPVVLSSALHNIGSDFILDLIVNVFPNPAARGAMPGLGGTAARYGRITPAPAGPAARASRGRRQTGPPGCRARSPRSR